MYTGASVRKSTVDSRICHGAWRGSLVDAMALVLATGVSCRGRGRGTSWTTERGIDDGDNTARAGFYESMEVEAGLQLASAKQFQFVFSRPMSDGIIRRGTQWLQFTDGRGFTWAASRRCHDDVYSAAGGWQGWPITEFGEGPLLFGFPSWGLQGRIGRGPRVLQGLQCRPKANPNHVRLFFHHAVTTRMVLCPTCPE